MTTATATANPNIAFIKYWGNRDDRLRIPANGSISMNLGGLTTRTQVTFDSNLQADELTLDGKTRHGLALERVGAFLDRVRKMAGTSLFALVESENNFPTGTGIASSASAFAALSLAATSAAGLHLSESELSRLARTGSGSACRSVPGGFVEWQAGTSHETSYAFSVAPPEHWDLTDCIAVVSQAHKATGSSEGHELANTSPLQQARVESAASRLGRCRRAILKKDFEALALVTELDSNMMHAVMMTSSPPLLYWEPATLEVIRIVQTWRKLGTPACYTIDAGPNVHVLCSGDIAPAIVAELRQIHGVKEVLTAGPGGAAQLISA